MGEPPGSVLVLGASMSYDDRVTLLSVTLEPAKQ